MTYASEVLADSPSGYWKLNESGAPFADSSGNGFEISSGETSGTFTAAGGATTPMGETSNSYNNGDTGPVMTAVTGRPYTLECWFYPTSDHGGCIIQRGDQGAGNGVGVGIGGSSHDFTTNGLEVIVLISNIAWRPTGYTLPSLNAWYHIVVVDNSTDLRVYVNGTLQATLSTTGPISPSNEMHIGRLTAGSWYVVGSIAQVAVYGSALSSTRVTAHYNARSSSLVAKADTDSFTLSESGSVGVVQQKASTDSFVSVERTNSPPATAPRATDHFVASELEFLNYTPTAPLGISFASHRVYASVGITNPPLSTPTRTLDIVEATTTLYVSLLDTTQTPIDLTDLTVTFDVATPGTRVEGTSGDISVSVSETVATVTIPGGFAPGVYSCRATVDSSGAYRSYPTEAITLVVS